LPMSAMEGESDYEEYEDDMDDEDEDMESQDEDDNWVDSDPVRQATLNYEVLDSAACKEMAMRLVRQVGDLLSCESEQAAILLRQFRWDQERLTTEFLEDPDKVLRRAGFHEGNAETLHVGDGSVTVGGKSKRASSLPEIQCLICYEQTKTYSALGCGHGFCNECYSTFLSHKIKDEGHECIFATCPQDKCPVLVSDRLVGALALPEGLRKQFDNANRLERSFVDDNPSLKWCTRPDCAMAVKARQGTLGVKCDCGTRFCFSCGQDDHFPSTCEDLKKWIVKCKDDSETFNWLVSNTKACPKCGTSIEKNGGCNHMTCKNSSCKYEFCWVCQGSWKDHSGSYYQCNKYDPEKDKQSESGKKRDSSRQALERYLHYYTRFTNHHNSLKFEVEAKDKMEQKIKEMEQLGDNTWMDCQYLNEANEALYECRYALQYTYVYAFYLPESGNYRHHFEMQQTELERQTEELAGHLEKDVAEIDRMTVVECYQMAKKRLRNLFDIVNSQSSEEAGSSSTS